MKKGIIFAIIGMACAMWIVGIVLVVRSVKGIAGQTGFSRPRAAPAFVLPKGPAPQSTLAVFHFRPSGDTDAKLYAVGLARALGDRLWCAPTAVTQQASVVAIADALAHTGWDPRKSPSDAAALQAGKTLHVRSVITGDLKLAGGSVEISARLSDVTGRTLAKQAKVSGRLSDLPALEASLAAQLAKEMGVRLTHEQAKSIAEPNFTNPEVIRIYARSLSVPDAKQRESLRWQAVDLDPRSSFAVIRLLELCYYGPSSARDIQKSGRLAKLRASLPSRFPGNSHIALLEGLLLSKECEYARAQEKLEGLTKADGTMARARSALALIALERGDSQLGMRESRRVVRDWPTNASFHALLARACYAVAGDARRGRFYSRMSARDEAIWRRNSEERSRESLIAVSLDPYCADGWRQLLNVSRELDNASYRDRAFEALTRIDRRDLDAYQDYAFCFVPQWGGSASDREAVFAKAERVFGAGSSSVCLLRARSMMRCYGRRDKAAELALLEKAVAKSKGQDPDCLIEEAGALRRAGRVEESLAIAESGFSRWGTLAWRWQVAQSCAVLFDQAGKRQFLDRAAIHFAKYAQEIPFSSDAQVQWGWCLSHQGDREGAKQKFLRALELNPDNEVAKEKMKYVE